MKCAACESENGGDARFCQHCGSVLTSPATRVACVACGAASTSNATFCVACGHKHGQPVAPRMPNKRWIRLIGVGLVVVIVLLGYTVFSGGKKASVSESADAVIPPEAAVKSGQKPKTKSTNSAPQAASSAPKNSSFARELEACQAKGFFERGICTEQVQWKHCTVNSVWDTTKPGCER